LNLHDTTQIARRKKTDDDAEQKTSKRQKFRIRQSSGVRVTVSQVCQSVHPHFAHTEQEFPELTAVGFQADPLRKL